MIHTLKIKNFVLIKETELEFDSNVNIILGETGVGKSLVFRALMQLCGDRSKHSLIMNGQDKYELTATFDQTKELKQKLITNGIALNNDKTIIVYRSFDENSKTKIMINNTNVTVNTLKLIMRDVLEITSQHDQRNLLDSSFYYQYLDKGNEMLHQNYLKTYHVYYEIKQELKNLKKQELQKEEQLDIIDYRLKELSIINDFESLNTLEIKINQLKEDQKSRVSLNTVLDAITSADNNLKQINPDDYRMLSDELIKRIDYVKYELEDLNFELSKTKSVNIDDDKIETLSEQISIYRKLMRKYNKDDIELKNMVKELEDKKHKLNSVEIDLQIIEKKYDEIEKEITTIYLKLYSKRQKNAIEYSKMFAKELEDLKMKDVKFDFRFEETAEYNKDGKHEISLYIQTNKGSKSDLISEVASGGELSRIMLAMKINQNNRENAVVVFDEIDTWVSGEVAQQMANKINKIAKNEQILMITHLPQVAAIATNIIVGEKQVSNNVTISKLQQINKSDFEAEIAKLISGSKVTKEAQTQAKNLIKEVQ